MSDFCLALTVTGVFLAGVAVGRSVERAAWLAQWERFLDWWEET